MNGYIIVIIILSIVVFVLSMWSYNDHRKISKFNDLEFTVDSLNRYKNDLESQLNKYKLKDTSKSTDCSNCDKVDRNVLRASVIDIVKLKRELHYKDVEIKCYKLLIEPYVKQSIVDDLIASMKDSVKFTSDIIVQEYKDNNQSKS